MSATESQDTRLDVSIVVPTYNEEDNVLPLFESTRDVLEGMKVSYEVIFVDDGSTAATLDRLLSLQHPHLKVIKVRKNFGQAVALDAGCKAVPGTVIVSMDADLQNDPKDIPRLLEKLEEGYDVVSGWRKDRRDPLTKRIVSCGANFLRKILIKENIHDSGCTLKVYRRECFDGLDLYGEMHRFVPARMQWRGFRVAELPVAHHKRRHGQTKYTIWRVLRGFLDMIVVNFWMNFSARPIHLFGTLGGVTKECQ
jgi:glycosyltransferase involved in cell wall biosynthesis